MPTPIKLSAATATIGPIIHGIGACQWSNKKPAGIPTASDLRMPGICSRKLANSFIEMSVLLVAVQNRGWARK
jgi:hypothetical protein